MKFARISPNGVVADIAVADDRAMLATMFHAELVDQFVEAPDIAEVGWVQSQGRLYSPDTPIQFYIDTNHVRWTTAGEGRSLVTGMFNAQLALDGNGWHAATVQEVEAQALAERHYFTKRECTRRILTVASTTAQVNLAGTAGLGMLTPPQLQAYQHFLEWVVSMRETAQALAGGPDDDCTADDKWPAVPDDVPALVGEF